MSSKKWAGKRSCLLVLRVNEYFIHSYDVRHLL